MTKVVIDEIEVIEARYQLPDLGKDSEGVGIVFQPKGQKGVTSFGYRVKSSAGIVGEYVGGDSPSFAQFLKFGRSLIGHDALAREQIYDLAKHALRKFDKMGIGPFDIALWDLAGKYYGSSVSELLGGWRKVVPCYASTMAGDRNGGLDSPDAFAKFALECKELGYPAFKLHLWDDYSLEEVIATVYAVREAVGEAMGLMLDPAGKLRSWLEAWQVGKACDEANFLWLEDLYKDQGLSIHGHARLRQLLRTPLLQTEHVRGLEEHVNFIQGGGTDLVRVDPEYDGGITGAMKIAHAAEGFGLDVEIHAPGPAQRQIMAAIRNTNFYEMALVHPLTTQIGRAQEIYADGYRDGLREIDVNGMVKVPDGAGLGVTYDWESLRAHAVDSVVLK